MREDEELRLAMIAIAALHAETGCTVTLRREPPLSPRSGAAAAAGGTAGTSVPGAGCGPPGWRARAIRGWESGDWDAWATRPYEAVRRLAEVLDARDGAVA